MDYFKTRGFSIDQYVVAYTILIMLLFTIALLVFAIELNRITEQYASVSQSLLLYRGEVELYQHYLVDYRKDCFPRQPHLVSGETVSIQPAKKIIKKKKLSIQAPVDDSIKDTLKDAIQTKVLDPESQ